MFVRRLNMLKYQLEDDESLYDIDFVLREMKGEKNKILKENLINAKNNNAKYLILNNFNSKIKFLNKNEELLYIIEIF